MTPVTVTIKDNSVRGMTATVTVSIVIFHNWCANRISNHLVRVHYVIYVRPPYALRILLNEPMKSVVKISPSNGHPL